MLKKFKGIEIGKVKKNIKIQNLYEKKYQYKLINLSKGKNFESNKINIGSLALMNNVKQKFKNYN